MMRIWGDVVETDVNVETDDLHMDIAAVVDYQSDETDVDAVADGG